MRKKPTRLFEDLVGISTILAEAIGKHWMEFSEEELGHAWFPVLLMRHDAILLNLFMEQDPIFSRRVISSLVHMLSLYRMNDIIDGWLRRTKWRNYEMSDSFGHFIGEWLKVEVLV